MEQPTTPEPPEAPAFESIPRAPRHDGWTPERQRRFVAAPMPLRTVSEACRAVGISPAAAYKLRKRADAASFAEAWDVALDLAHDRILKQSFDRALHGYTRPVRYAGLVIGQWHVFDNRFAYALAYGERPRGGY